MRSYIVFLFIVFILAACDNNKTTPATTVGPDTMQVKQPAVNKDSLILSLTRQVLTTLKTGDYKSFSTFMHPILGTRFTPYTFVDTAMDKRFTPSEFLDLAKKNTPIDWGSYDGTGDSILLTVKGYFKKFVYNADFLNAEKTSLNKTLGAGTDFNNLEIVYKDCEYTESFFSGFEEKYDGMDWTALRLVYKKYQDKYYLVGVIHGSWTI
jgi:hypothetical protein